jgi:hypothetical protein
MHLGSVYHQVSITIPMFQHSNLSFELLAYSCKFFQDCFIDCIYVVIFDLEIENVSLLGIYVLLNESEKLYRIHEAKL